MPRLLPGVYCRPNKDGQPRYYVRLLVQGQRHRFGPHGGWPKLADANAFVIQARADLAKSQFAPATYQREGLTLASVIDLYINPDEKNHVAYRAWWVAQHGEQDVAAISPEWLTARQRELAQEKSPQTVHHYLKFLRYILNQAVKNGRLSTSPFVRFTLRQPIVHRDVFLTDAQIARLMAALGPDWGSAAEFAVLTGLRWREQFGLTRDRVDLERGVVVLPTTKAGRPQIRMLNDRAVEIVRERIRTGPGPYLWGSGEAIDYSNWHHRIWQPAKVTAGLPDQVRWHDLRHTFASKAATSQTDRTLAVLLGHTSTAMVSRYAHLLDDHLHRAVEKVTIKRRPS